MLGLTPRMLAAVLALGVAAAAQQPYQPKSKDDPARSREEAVALGYMRTLVNAQREYKKRHERYAPSLQALVGKGSFTRRMTRTDRGLYTVEFRGGAEGFQLTLTPKEIGPELRAFFVDESGAIRVEETQPATRESPVLKPDERTAEKTEP